MSADNDPISELMAKEGLSYPEAVERLAGVKLGATGEPEDLTFLANDDAGRQKSARPPQGKVEDGDEGRLVAALSTVGGKLRIDFGPKPVAWVTLTPDEAIAFGSSLIDRAVHIKNAGARAVFEAFGQSKQ